jgi:hypothetical protein
MTLSAGITPDGLLVEQVAPVRGDDEEKPADRQQYPCDRHPESARRHHNELQGDVPLVHLSEGSRRDPNSRDQDEQEGQLGELDCGRMRKSENEAHADSYSKLLLVGIEESADRNRAAVEITLEHGALGHSGMTPDADGG